MAIKLDDSLRWQTEQADELERNLRVLFPETDSGVVAHVLASYRQGWNDCFRAARMHGVAKLD
jgi:hypothetical protein